MEMDGLKKKSKRLWTNMPNDSSMEDDEEGSHEHMVINEEDWSEEDVEQFANEMRQKQMESLDRGKSGPKPNTGIVWAGLALASLIIYGLYTGLPMNFTLWITTLLVVLALGNKAIQ